MRSHVKLVPGKQNNAMPWTRTARDQSYHCSCVPPAFQQENLVTRNGPTSSELNGPKHHQRERRKTVRSTSIISPIAVTSKWILKEDPHGLLSPSPPQDIICGTPRAPPSGPESRTATVKQRHDHGKKVHHLVHDVLFGAHFSAC